MKTFTVVEDINETTTTTVEEDFNSSLVVEVNYGINFNGWQTIRKSVVNNKHVKQAYGIYRKGVSFPLTESWLLHTSYYWLVRRSNGSLYPWPLIFATSEERLISARRKNDEQWDLFYSGVIPSPRPVDCPSDEEVADLLTQVEELIFHGEALWDHLDQRGGLVPRWAA